MPHSTASIAAEPGQANGDGPASRNPWLWVPTLYFAEGIPYTVVVSASIVLYKSLGVSNTRIALYTSWLSLPWVLKPFWSPVVDILKTRRLWIWLMQMVVGAGFAGIALTVSGPDFIGTSLAFFSLLAFTSATHDIAADGFYILALTEGEQSFFSGIRNTVYRVAMICGQGLLVMLAGRIQRQTGRTALAWQVAFGAAAGLILLLATYHRFILPRPASDQPAQPESAGGFFRECLATFAAFFSKQKIVLLLLFLLFYRLGEAQLVKMVQPFLMDPRAAGGLGLTLEQVGFVYSTLGLAMLILGGIAGGVLVSRHGLRAWLWPMVFIMHLPDAVFIYLSRSQPENLSLIAACIAVEQFGYGFGFTAYMLYMIYIARGRHQTAHYAICTGFMALGFMVPGMWSGWLQEQIGYRHFFLWVMLATVPGFILTALIPLDADFGKRGRN